MLSPEIIRKIKKIHFKSGRMVNSLMAGQYRSVFRGVGIEFEEVREYSPGDDIKSIDWKVSARLGKPFVKRFREERELIVMLLVDLSASGRFGTVERTKQETAAEVAAVMAFNAIRNNDKVGAILFTDQVEKYIPPKKGSSHVWRVIKEIFTFMPIHSGTDLEGAVSYLGRVCRKRTVSFLISDFIHPKLGGEVPLKLKSVSRRHEMIGILISDPGDRRVFALLCSCSPSRRPLTPCRHLAGQGRLFGHSQRHDPSARIGDVPQPIRGRYPALAFEDARPPFVAQTATHRR